MTLEPLKVIIPHSSSHRLHPPPRKGEINYDSGGFSRTVFDMEEQLTELRHMFAGTNPLQQRTIAALKIQTIFRSYSSRKKFHAYHISFQSWRFGRSKIYLPFLENGLARAGEIEMNIDALSIRREYRLIVAIFSRWKHICKQSAPFRLSIRSAAEEKYLQFVFRLKSRVCDFLCSVPIIVTGLPSIEDGYIRN